jgi:hypothetical protein
MGKDMKPAYLSALFLFLLCFVPNARADVTILLEEPYSYDGAFAGTGHSAIYLTRVCAASPTLLRRCEPGEHGVVISRYDRIGGYDWIAIPLIPYLYAVARPEEIPLYADSKLVAFLRDQYRQKYLEDLAPDSPSGGMPGGDWVQLVGSAYDRTSYGYQIESTAAQDDKFIEWMNTRPNTKTYEVVSRNCADFVREVLNFYYPKAVSRGFISDFGVLTPKHAAKSLVKYSQRHRDLEFTSFVVPQVPGSIRRSKPIRGLVESVFKAKKYVVPLAFLNPFVAGGFATAYMISGRFNPSKNALVFSPNDKPQPPLTKEDRRIFKKNIDDLMQADLTAKPALDSISWQEFRRKALPNLDLEGHPILHVALDDRIVELGISRGSIFSGTPPSELQSEFLVARLRADLAAGRAPTASRALVQADWNLLQKVVSAEQARITAQAIALQELPH